MTVKQSARVARWPVLVGFVLVEGCTRAPEEAVRTVEYYRAHDAEREDMLATCGNDPGTLSRAPNCVNAREAARREGIGSLRDLPPLGLPGGEAPKDEAAPERPER
jgi:hypothetical protein